MMTNSTWAKTLLLFEQNLSVLTDMQPVEPAPTAKLCRESAHRTLGHLTACQTAWLPYLRQIKEGLASGSIPINPDPLYSSLSYGSAEWQVLVQRFTEDRAEWRQLLKQVDLDQPLQTPKRTLSARTLTRRMIEHEKRHLDALPCNPLG